MNTELPEPVDSSTSEHVTGAELRMQQALADICNGVGWSNDKQLARHYGVTRKTIWDWVREGRLPKPKKLTPRRTRWSNAEIAQHDQKIKNLEYKQFMEALYEQV